MPRGRAMGTLNRAALHALGGDREKAVQTVERAEQALEEAEALLYRAAARRRRGLLIGGDEGRVLVGDAEAFMRQQSIRSLDGMSQLLTPGY